MRQGVCGYICGISGLFTEINLYFIEARDFLRRKLIATVAKAAAKTQIIICCACALSRTFLASLSTHNPSRQLINYWRNAIALAHGREPSRFVTYVAHSKSRTSAVAVAVSHYYSLPAQNSSDQFSRTSASLMILHPATVISVDRAYPRKIARSCNSTPFTFYCCVSIVR